MIVVEILGFLLLAWVALECLGYGIDWIERHAAALTTWAVILATLGGLHMWLGAAAVAWAVAMLIVAGVALDLLR